MPLLQQLPQSLANKSLLFKFSDPSFMEIDSPMHLPCTHFNPAFNDLKRG
jgi:hypothetical protein